MTVKRRASDVSPGGVDVGPRMCEPFSASQKVKKILVPGVGLARFTYRRDAAGFQCG